MQTLADNFRRQVNSIFGIAGHSKSDIDHIAGLTTVAICREVVAGEKLWCFSDMVAHLSKKFEAH